MVWPFTEKTDKADFEKFQDDVNSRIRDVEDKMKVLKDELSAAIQVESRTMNDRITNLDSTVRQMVNTKETFTADEFQRQFGNRITTDMANVQKGQVALGVRVSNINSRMDSLESQIKSLADGKPKPEAEPTDKQRDRLQRQIEKVDKDIARERTRIIENDEKIAKSKNSIDRILRSGWEHSGYVANTGSFPTGMPPMSLSTKRAKPTQTTASGPTPVTATTMMGVPGNEEKDLDAQGRTEEKRPTMAQRLGIKSETRRGDYKDAMKQARKADIKKIELDIKLAEQDTQEALRVIANLQDQRGVYEKGLISLQGNTFHYSGYSWIPMDAMGL